MFKTRKIKASETKVPKLVYTYNRNIEGDYIMHYVRIHKFNAEYGYSIDWMNFKSLMTIKWQENNPNSRNDSCVKGKYGFSVHVDSDGSDHLSLVAKVLTTIDKNCNYNKSPKSILRILKKKLKAKRYTMVKEPFTYIPRPFMMDPDTFLAVRNAVA